MKLVLACSKILDQLADLVNAIQDDDFVKPSPALSQATIGQHIRHTLEFFICFEQGCRTGSINYDKRSHDKLIETERQVAFDTIDRITSFVTSLDLSLPLRLEINYDPLLNEFEVLETTSARELVYNIEHAVHHMALIKIGVKEVVPYVSLPSDFGVAASTIRHRQPMNGNLSVSDAVAQHNQ